MAIRTKVQLPARKGFALLITFLLFALFYMLSVVFLINAFIQRILVRNYVNMVKARYVAEAGVHDAVGNILADFSFLAHAQNMPVDYRWRYRDQGKAVEYASYPSYAVLDEEGNPREVRIVMGERELRCGYSGWIQSGSYGINSDIWHLKVLETSAQLYVNEGIYAAGVHPYNTAVMRRILNRLGEQVGIGNLGELIIGNRPANGYRSKAQLEAVLGKEIYESVKDFLCVHTWSDTQVANPVPLSIEAKEAYRVDKLDSDDWPVIYQTRPGYPENTIARYGRGKVNEFRTKKYGYIFGYPLNEDPLVFGQPIWGWQELNPCYIEITSRAPVNINTAPREILVALLSDLEGFFVLEQLRQAGGGVIINIEEGDVQVLLSWRGWLGRT
jgi:hypothetical protein